MNTMLKNDTQRIAQLEETIARYEGIIARFPNQSSQHVIGLVWFRGELALLKGEKPEDAYIVQLIQGLDLNWQMYTLVNRTIEAAMDKRTGGHTRLQMGQYGVEKSVNYFMDRVGYQSRDTINGEYRKDGVYVTGRDSEGNVCLECKVEFMGPATAESVRGLVEIVLEDYDEACVG